MVGLTNPCRAAHLPKLGNLSFGAAQKCGADLRGKSTPQQRRRDPAPVRNSPVATTGTFTASTTAGNRLKMPNRPASRSSDIGSAFQLRSDSIPFPMFEGTAALVKAFSSLDEMCRPELISPLWSP
jgi:hypothetical protein